MFYNFTLFYDLQQHLTDLFQSVFILPKNNLNAPKSIAKSKRLIYTLATDCDFQFVLMGMEPQINFNEKIKEMMDL